MRKNKTFEAYLSNNRLIDNKSINQTEDANFFTSDTEAFINVRPMDIDFNFESAKIMMVNHEDGSIVTRQMQVDTELRIANYEIEADLMPHYGEWSAQVLFNSSGETFTSDVLRFKIKRHLTDQAQPKLEDIESYTEFMKKASQELKNIQAKIDEKLKPVLAKIDEKQDKLTAGQGIKISGNEISSESQKYTAGTNIQISSQGVISATDTKYDDRQLLDKINEKQDKLTAGTNVVISGNTISSIDTKYDDSSIKNQISQKQDKLTSGTNITILGNTISAKDTIYDDSEIQLKIKNLPKKYVANIGDGTNSEYTVSHNLGTKDVVLSVYQNGQPYEEYLFEVYRTNINQVKLVANRAIKQNEFRVVIVG